LVAFIKGASSHQSFYLARMRCNSPLSGSIVLQLCMNPCSTKIIYWTSCRVQ